MIFAIDGHISLIKEGKKTQTRRSSSRYKVGHSYAIQPGYKQHGIPDGKIRVIRKWEERAFYGRFLREYQISVNDAMDEGGYEPDEFEALYKKLHPDWLVRWAYEFEYIPLD